MKKSMIVAGMMSGTSGDGIDTAFVRIAPRRGGLSLELLGHHATAFPRALRDEVLAAQDAARTSTATLAKLNWRLGMAYAAAYRRALTAHPAPVELIGCHGQTVYHQGAILPYAGERFRCTWQIGEMAPLAREAGVPVVSNFRANDMEWGGQGAPLVPLLDSTLYRHATRTRLLLNIGGIANVTLVPSQKDSTPVRAFDTGPGNMVLDALMLQLFKKPFDRSGSTAARGTVLEPVLRTMLRERFFRQKPPRSAGREQYGAAYTAAFLKACRTLSKKPEDAIATATALTAHSIHDAVVRFAASGAELIVAGGGAYNETLMAQLAERFAATQTRVLTTSDASLPTPLPVEAKEAVAFALLAYMSHTKQPGNIPSATGAALAVVLGQVTCA